MIYKEKLGLINQILFQGSFAPEQVSVELVEDSLRQIDPELEEKALRQWQADVVKAKAEGKKVWDSETYRLESFGLDGECLSLKLGVIPYSIRIGLNRFGTELIKLGQEYFSSSLYASVYVKTADDKYVFVEKSEKYRYLRKYSFVGGVLSKDELEIGVGEDLFVMAGKELVEELGVRRGQIEGLALIGAYTNEHTNVCLVFKSELPLTARELLAVFDKEHDDEVEKLVFVDLVNLKEFILASVKVGDNIVRILNNQQNK